MGCAVWFAARGQGKLGNGHDRGKPIVSTSRVGVNLVCHLKTNVLEKKKIPYTLSIYCYISVSVYTSKNTI